jgi:uncharacterized protein (TIGR02246 family)
MSTSQAPGANTEQQLTQLAEQWAAAEQSADTGVIEHTLADDFVGIGPLGFLLSKQEWLQRHQSGALQYTAFTLDDTQVRVYGDAAVMIGRITQTATYQGHDTSGQFRTTLVWVRQQGSWRLANLQLSTLGQPPAWAGSQRTGR